ncbi:syntabulin [Aplochiton taeniatus]
MGPFQEYEDKKSPEKGSPRSRIPRLVLHPFLPKEKGSPLSDSPVSEEEGKEGDMSSGLSKRTVSTNSYCSDDTGCPTSQSVSPSKTPSGSDKSPHSSPLLPERKVTKVKRVRVMAEWKTDHPPTARHKRERSHTLPRGSEADFSSSSSRGSLKGREGPSSCSTGKKNPSRSRISHIRSLPVFKPAGNPVANKDAELYAPYRTPPKAPYSTTNSSSNSSPTSRRASLGRYHSCGDNHGIRPPNPEQYLTPLQQKEVAIRHLRTKLRESETTVHDRETEIEELKAQLGRMREDWIEEECHRVEAQLSLKEARKEIKQLRQVVETMKGSLVEKDKGIQKYFIDINIQNRKLESLLHSMEMAQCGATLNDEPTLDFVCDDNPPARSPRGGDKLEEGDGGNGGLGDQAAEEMADSELLVNDEMANRADILEHVLMSTVVDPSKDLRPGPGPGVSSLMDEGEEMEMALEKGDAPPGNAPYTTFTLTAVPTSGEPEEKAIQTDMVSIAPEVQALLFQLLKLHGGAVGGEAASSCFLGLSGLPTPSAAALSDLTPSLPAYTLPAPPKGCDATADSGMCSFEPTVSRKFMEELDFSVEEEEEEVVESSSMAPGMEVVSKFYWSNSFLIDLVAVAAPVLPTVAWLYSRHGVDGGAPVYNIASLLRACCIMGLHSLRHITRGPAV